VFILALVACVFVAGVAADCKTGDVTCPALQVCVSDLSGATTGYVCLAIALTCNPACATGQNCVLGTCLGCAASVCPFDPLATAAQAQANAQLSLAVGAAFDGSSASLTTSTTVAVSAQPTITAADGALTKLTATGSAAYTGALTLGATAGSQAAVSIDAGVTFSTNSVAAVGSKTAIIVAAGAARLNASAYAVAAGLQSAISFQASAATSTSSSSSATIGTLNLQGTLVVSGEGSVNFPQSASASSQTTTAATVKAGGGVIVSGVIGAASLTVGGVNKASNTARVKAQGTFQTSGNIVSGAASGASTAATLQVYGGLQFGGSAITNVNLNIQGTTSTAGGAAGSTTGQVEIQAATVTQTGANTVQGGAIIRLDHASTNIQLGGFTACSADSFIDVVTTSSVIASGSASGTAFRFDSSTTTTANMLCNLRLVDPTGAQATVVLTNTNNASTGRRLLASSGSSTWSNGQVTYTYGSGKNGASSNTASGIVVVLSALVAFFVARRV